MDGLYPMDPVKLKSLECNTTCEQEFEVPQLGYVEVGELRPLVVRKKRRLSDISLGERVGPNM